MAIFSVFSHGFPSTPVCVQISFLVKDNSRIGLEPTLMAHFNLITFLKTLSLNSVTFKGQIHHRAIYSLPQNA